MASSISRRRFLRAGAVGIGSLGLGEAMAGPAGAAGERKPPSPSLQDWPMLGHDPARSGTTAVEVRPPFARKWYRLFTDEGLMSGVQPVAAGGRIYLGTQAGILHA